MTQKELFPFFKKNDIVYLDSASTTQKPESVLNALNSAYINATNISRSSYPLANKNFEMVEQSRLAVAELINANEKQIIFTFSATDSINMIVSLLKLKKDEKILLSKLEHHSNILPFLNKYPKQVIFCEIDNNGDISLKDYENKLKNNNVKFVSFTGMSNVIGRIQDIKKLTTLAHIYNAKILIDATQLIAHSKIDVKKIDCDYLVFSSHKIYGSCGVGILYAKNSFDNNYRLGGGIITDIKDNNPVFVSAPYLYEAGTMPIPEIISLREAVSFISKIKKGYSKVFVSYLEKELKKIGAEVLGNPQEGNISFYFKNISSYDIAFLLGQKNICVRGGNHCCSLLHLYYKVNHTIRVSFGIYNDLKDCEIFISTLKEVLQKLGLKK